MIILFSLLDTAEQQRSECDWQEKHIHSQFQPFLVEVKAC